MFVACVISACVVMAEASPARTPVILTSDCGTEIDDQWAVAHLALSPRVELRGVVTTHAPGLTSDASARAVQLILEQSARGSIPVFAGSSIPLADRTKPFRNAGVDFILEQSKHFNAKNRLRLFVIGAATDAASALLVDPTLADRVAIIAMGFESWPKGGPEWNVKNDGRAWQVLLASNVPIVVADAAIAKKSLLMTPDDVVKRLAHRAEPGPTLVAQFNDWMTKHPEAGKSVTGLDKHWPIWDEATTAYLLGFAHAESHPRPTLRDDLIFDLAHPRGTIEWITSIDAPALWDDLAKSIDAPR